MMLISGKLLITFALAVVAAEQTYPEHTFAHDMILLDNYIKTKSIDCSDAQQCLLAASQMLEADDHHYRELQQIRLLKALDESTDCVGGLLTGLVTRYQDTSFLVPELNELPNTAGMLLSAAENIVKQCKETKPELSETVLSSAAGGAFSVLTKEDLLENTSSTPGVIGIQVGTEGLKALLQKLKRSNPPGSTDHRLLVQPCSQLNGAFRFNKPIEQLYAIKFYESIVNRQPLIYTEMMEEFSEDLQKVAYTYFVCKQVLDGLDTGL